ncbi:MAG: Hpt domain-containing protein [Alphaproteobacteria bacterium]
MTSPTRPNGNYQMINRPNVLKAKVANPAPGPAIDPAVLAQAEAAIASMRGEFEERMTDEAARLVQLVDGFAAADGQLKAIFRVAHELRGQGGTFGYPMVTEIGTLLCDYIEKLPDPAAADRSVLRAHAEALNAVVANRVQGDGGATGAGIVDGLRVLVNRGTAG